MADCGHMNQVRKDDGSLKCTDCGKEWGGPQAIPMLLVCPECGARHVDKGEFAEKIHHTHACQECGMVWRPAIVPTVGVQFLPGFKDAD